MEKPTRMTYAELYDEVARLAKSLRDSGVSPGDRVVGFMPNMPQTIIAMLAATSIGADLVLLLARLRHQGRARPLRPDRAENPLLRPTAIRTTARRSLPRKSRRNLQEHSPRTAVVVVPVHSENADISIVPNSIHYDDFISKEKGLEIEFEQLPFDHPLYIMYSSGTTGLPKCMVQSAGGILHPPPQGTHAPHRPQARRRTSSTSPPAAG